MKIHTFLFLMALFSYIIVNAQEVRYFEPDDFIEYDTIPYMVKDKAFEESFKELKAMFDGEMPYSLKRAEFLVENAFFGGMADYDNFCRQIDSVAVVLNHFLDLNDLRKYKTGPNYALFEYFTKSSPMNGDRRFTYDFDDPMGINEFNIHYTSPLLRTHKGQMTSMPLL